MKNILGLDLGTNSIGWAMIYRESNEKVGIKAAGSRIIPMDASVLGDFDSGVTKSQTAERTGFRSVRRMRERLLLRRERLHKILSILGFLPSHYADAIDLYSGKFKKGVEVKLPWRKSKAYGFDFLFQDSFDEMMTDFQKRKPDFVLCGSKVPYDWTIYYLRTKALREKITKEELAWILLNFNQKRGYYQLRGEEVEKNNKEEKYYALKVIDVQETNDRKGKDVWYNIVLENGWIYRRSSNIPLDWVGKTKEFIVTTDLNQDGTPRLDKNGEVKRSFRAPKEDDWSLVKKKTEEDIINSKKKVGEYIYDSLLENPQQKIIGGLVRTIERKHYKDELYAIIEKQSEFHPELQNDELYKCSINRLLPQNEAHKNNIANRGFAYLLIEDILFYQRPLKTKKSLISNCPYETTKYIDKDTGEIKDAPVKCIAKSHPLYQEFRLWQFVENLKIYQREKQVDNKLQTDVDVTKDFLNTADDYIALFDWLNTRKEIDQNAFLKYPGLKLKKNAQEFRWNYVEDKKYPCNETKGLILSFLAKASVSADF